MAAALRPESRHPRGDEVRLHPPNPRPWDLPPSSRAPLQSLPPRLRPRPQDSLGAARTAPARGPIPARSPALASPIRRRHRERARTHVLRRFPATPGLRSPPPPQGRARLRVLAYLAAVGPLEQRSCWGRKFMGRGESRRGLPGRAAPPSVLPFSSVAQSFPTLCDPMNRSTPGLSVHHQLPEFTQTHVRRVSDAIQPSHPLSSPSPAPNPSQHQSLFQ